MSSAFLRCFISVGALFGAGMSSLGAEPQGNFIMNGGFEAGMQFWRGEGKNVLLADGNRVCELDAAKNRMRQITQDFNMKQLPEVEVVFRARSVSYVGAEITVSGIIGRCEVVTKDGVRLNVDLQQSKVEAP